MGDQQQTLRTALPLVAVAKKPDAAGEQQTLAVKRAQVEFHRFAALGEPERAMAMYAGENVRRGDLLERHLPFCGALSPFLELGANVGHSSYMLANRFGAEGFALDISADALRQGLLLKESWGLSRDVERIAGDAANLPFADGSLQFVFAFQTLSQFQDLDAFFAEVVRVLAPGGVFFFSEEPMKRMLSARLFRSPYYAAMKPWERKLWDWGLLPFLVRDVVGAQQEEGFGIRQNHRFALPDWDRLIRRHFAAHEFELTIPERGWLESAVRRWGRRIDKHNSDWVPARLLGGTLAAFCRKAGSGQARLALRCPSCHAELIQSAAAMRCEGCAFVAPNEGGVYTLLPAEDRDALYPDFNGAAADFSDPRHEILLGDGWYDVEGIHGNKYRWMAGSAWLRLTRPDPGPQRLRVRGFVHEGLPVTVGVTVNGQQLQSWRLNRPGLAVLEVDLPRAESYVVELDATPVRRPEGEDRDLSWIVSLVRLIPQD